MTADDEIESQKRILDDLLIDLRKKEIQLNQQLSDRTMTLQLKDPVFQQIFGRLDEIKAILTELSKYEMK